MVMKKLFIFFALLGINGVANASQAVGYLEGFLTSASGARFTVWTVARTSDPAHPAPPASCNGTNRYELGNTTAADQSVIAILLTAFAAHKVVTINGTGACYGGTSDVEGVSSVNVDP